MDEVDLSLIAGTNL
ncbi:hypothetical protein A2U01_0089736, partial [Trifolium medium]|nr:hypothetical protein [Trifolium medium]